jgi:hypothetical protein
MRASGSWWSQAGCGLGTLYGSKYFRFKANRGGWGREWSTDFDESDEAATSPLYCVGSPGVGACGAGDAGGVDTGVSNGDPVTSGFEDAASAV